MQAVRRVTLLLAFGLLVFGSAHAQTDTFSDPNVDYSFTVPDPAWKVIARPSSTNPNVEYVYNDRRLGHFEVRKLAIGKTALMPDVVRDEEDKLQFQPGYVAGKEENFSGILRGTAFNFEFVRGGRSMAGRFYFLRVNDTTIYVLRFTGERDSMKSIRNQTDSIARTFAVKH
jgi:hypothetical protein